MTIEEYEEHKRKHQRSAELPAVLFTIIWKGSLVLLAILIFVH
jgi:hypothetical protein